MKKYLNLLCFVLIFSVLVGCSSNDSEKEEPTQKTNTPNSESVKETETKEGTSEESVSKDINIEPVDKDSTNDTGKNEQQSLSQYTNEELEYARIWLQLGVVKDVEELNVRHISKGELVKPDNKESAAYPKDAIQLSGSRLVDGSVTYSSNSDGTIDVYSSVPLRWEGIPDNELEEGAIRTVTERMIKEVNTVKVDVGNETKIKELIKVIATQK